LELPASLGGLLEEIGSDDRIVPGHGPVVDRDFAVAQLADLTALARRLRRLHGSGATADQAIAELSADPALRVEGLELAVNRAFSSLTVS
jgi:glyoxylase-like metal-dependent hydrolase (beta-lactamase superfamily II)